MAWQVLGPRLVLLICLLVAAASGAGPTNADSHSKQVSQLDRGITPGLWGADTRTPVPARLGYIKPMVGRLVSEVGEGIVCTAFCVGDDIVATASHCLFSANRTRSRVPLSSFHVDFADRDKLASSTIAGKDEASKQWNVVAGTTHFPVHSPLYNARDWALLKLAAPICRRRQIEVVPIPKTQELLKLVHGKKLFTIGYMVHSHGIELLYSGNCETTPTLALLRKVWAVVRSQFVDPENIIPHRCGFAPGASGSPVLAEIEGRVVVIALNNGTVPVPAYLLIGKSPEQQRKIIRAMPEAANIAVSAMSFKMQIEQLRTTQKAVSTDAIKEIQIRFGRAGLYAGEVNGAFNPALRQAILDSQRNRGVLPTGRPNLVLTSE